MTSDNQPIWQKLNEHEKTLTQLTKEIAALQAYQRSMESRMDKVLEAIETHHQEYKKELDEIVNKLDNVNDTVNQARGGLKLGGWIFAALTTLAGIAMAMWKLFGGSR